MTRILVLSTLFPNAQTPHHGVFVENRLRAFLNRHDADVRVIAPVPWFPLKSKAFGGYAEFANAPVEEDRDGLSVTHPRYFVAPKLGMQTAPASLRGVFKREIRKLIDSGWAPDLIDAHYFYPDGVAAFDAAQAFDLPIVITARGTDINLIPKFAGPRARIVNAARRADAVIAVADALKTELVRLGAFGEKITVLRNGVDLDQFRPLDPAAAKQRLGLSGVVIASVGHLIDRKGHDLVIKALREIPETTLLIAGDGPERGTLARLAAAEDCADRVRFLGRIPHDELNAVYSACDALVLASSREGWPNVLLEAMACGAPCVATPVWGSGEVIREPAAGRLAKTRTPGAIAAAVNELLRTPPNRDDTRRYAEKHSWHETADGVARIFNEVIENKQAEKAAIITPVANYSGAYTPRLIVTVDTEESFDWSDFEATRHSVPDIDGLARFQSICEDAGAKPHYFITHPLLMDNAIAAFFKNLETEQRAICGLHLHQWVNPPGNYRGVFYSYQKNLPRGQYLEKLHVLADAFEAEIGRRAEIHRAGRYGISRRDYDLLAQIGVKHDFSPSPGFDLSADGGPSFVGMSNAPFRVRTPAGDVFVTPVSGARITRGVKRIRMPNGAAPGFPEANRKRRSLEHPLRITPEGGGLKLMQQLTRRLVAARTPVMTFTIHSTSLIGGGNRYAANARQVDKMMNDAAAYFSWFADKFGGVFETSESLIKRYKEKRV